MPGAAFFHAALRDQAVEHLLAGVSVDLRGQKGSGRTELVASITSALVERGWDVTMVHGIATLDDRPLEALGVAGLVQRADMRGRSTVSVAVQMVEHAVADRRTVLVVDDADDLDRASCGAVTAAHAHHPFPVLTTTRPRPGRDGDIAALASELRPGVQLCVPPLGYVDVHALLDEILGGPVDPDVTARVHGASGGLPGLVVAIAHTARRSGRLQRDDGVWTAPCDLWDPALTASIRQLVGDLDERALEALQTLALAGAVHLDAAVTLVGWEALEDLDACHLLQFVPHGDDAVVAISPSLVEESYRRGMSGARRLRFSQRLRDVLGTDVPPVTDFTGACALSRPWLPTPGTSAGQAAAAPEPQVVSDTVLDRLARDEWQAQLTRHRIAWEIHPTAQTAVPYLQSLLAGSADTDTTLDVIRRTPPPQEPDAAAALHRWHADVLAYAAGDVDAARALLDQAAADSGPWATMLLAHRDHLLIALDHVPPARGIRPPGDSVPDTPDSRQFDEAATAARLIAGGRPQEASAILADARWTDPALATIRSVLVGLAHLAAGDPRAAYAWGSEELRRARAELDTQAIPGHAYVTTSALMLLGRTRQVREVLSSVLSIGLRPAMQRHYSSMLLGTASVLAHSDGLVTTVSALAEQAEVAPLGPGVLFLLSPPPPETSRDPAQVTATASMLWHTAGELFDRGYVVSGTMHAGSAIDLDPDPARLARLHEMTDSVPANLVRAIVRVADATVSADVDAATGVGHDLIEAGNVALGTRAIAAAARRLRDAGDAREASRLLRETRWRVQKHGVEPGSLLGSLTPRAGLTPRELTVGMHVANGLSNPEIAERLGLSVKTVENHLNSILRKLGVSARDDVARVLRA